MWISKINVIVLKIPAAMMEHLKQISDQLRMDQKTIVEILQGLARIAFDQDFIQQVLDINENITEMSAEN